MRRVLLATLAASAAACGDGVAPPDAMPAPDAGVGLVRVHYRTNTFGARGHRVIFQAADSRVLAATLTDGEGRANAFVPAHTTVTLVLDDGISSPRIYTQLDTSPGEELVIDARTQDLGAPTTFDVTVPDDPAGSGSFALYTSCGPYGITGADLEPTSVTLINCDGAAAMLVMSGDQLRFLYRGAQPLRDGDDVAFTGAYLGVQATRVDAVNIPSDLPQIGVVQRLVGLGREIYPIGGATGFLAVEGGAASTTLSQPLPVDGTLMTQLDPQVFDRLSVPHVIQWGPASQTTTVDVAARTLRPLTAAPRYQPDANLVRWEEGAGVRGDAVLAGFSWFAEDSGINLSWTVLAPRVHDASWVTLPVLPIPWLVPPAIDAFTFATISIDGGWDRLRGSGVLARWWPQQGYVWPATGSEGRVDTQELQFLGEF